MNWTELLTSEIEETYRATEGLMRRVDDAQLGWMPTEGNNWMSMGQLLEHCTTACGFCMRGLVTGDWGMPEGASIEDMRRFESEVRGFEDLLDIAWLPGLGAELSRKPLE